MATLEKIRSKAGLLIGVVGVALLAFVIGDFLKSGSTFFHQSKEKILVVGSESVSIQDFQAKLEEMTDVYKKRVQTNTVSEEIQSGLREEAFNTMVTNLILKHESEKLGMAVGKDELSSLIIGDNISPLILQMPDFQNPQTGMFDKNMLLQFLQTIESDNIDSYPLEMRAQILEAKNYWLFWEQTIKQQRLQSKYSVLLGSVISTNSIEARSAFEDKKINVGFEYVVQNYQTIADEEISVSDSEIKSLYNNRKNLYKQDRQQVISYIAVDIVPSSEDDAAVYKQVSELRPAFEEPNIDVTALVNENSDMKFIDAYLAKSELREDMQSFIESANVNDVSMPVLSENSYVMLKLVGTTVAPDSIKINQLVLPGIDEQFIKSIADSIAGVIKGGKTFAEVATIETQGRSNGEMDYMTEAQLVAATDPNFKDQVFSATIGEVFVAKSVHGSHLVQVVEKTAPVTKYKIAVIQIAVTPSSETFSKLYNDLSTYASKNNTLEKFKESAAESGYIVQNEMPLTENQPAIANIASSRPAIRWAFDNKKGSISEIFECQDRFLVVAVDGSLKEGYRSLASVSEILKREILNDKKAERIISELKAKNLSTIAGYAEEMNSTVNTIDFVSFATFNITGMGIEPTVNAIIPFVEEGQLTAPFKGKAGVYVLNITSKSISDAPYNEESEKQALQSTNMQRMGSFFPILKDKFKVEDNRIRFY